MALNIEKILNHIGESKEEFSNNVEISLEELDLLISDQKKLTEEQLATITSYTGLMPEDIATNIHVVKNTMKYAPSNTWSPSKSIQGNLSEYVKANLPHFEKKEIIDQIKTIDECISSLVKPKISFAGQSDTGKSTVINCLLGKENMPAKWTPTTSIVVYIKHISDKPDFMKEDVWVFKNDGNEIWDETCYKDKNYCEGLCVAKGGFEKLEEYGIHHGDDKQAATSAVAFIDSPILLDCDIVDLPGFSATEEDNAAHYYIAHGGKSQKVDILIYLSRANGFLQDVDKEYLRECLKVLRPVEKKGSNDVPKLANLFVVASHASAVQNGNYNELNRILDEQCHAFCRPLIEVAEKLENGSILPERSNITKYAYKEEDFRTRFFTFEKNSTRLCKEFNKSLNDVIEMLPVVYYKDFVDSLKDKIKYSEESISRRITEFTEAIENREDYRRVYESVMEKEPGRKVKARENKREILSNIDNYRITNNQSFRSFYSSFMTTENLIGIIEKNDYKCTRSDKESFAIEVQKTLEGYVEKTLKESSKEYIQKVDEYIDRYVNEKEYDLSQKMSIHFDGKAAFAAGVEGTGARGATAAWLATSGLKFAKSYLAAELMLTALLLPLAPVIGLIKAIISFSAFSVKWKKDLVNRTIRQYEEKKYCETVEKSIDTYWEETKISFEKANDIMEIEWENKIKEIEKAVNEESIPILQKELRELEEAKVFFIQMPLPESK